MNYMCLSVISPFLLHPLFSTDKDLRQQVVALLRKKSRAAAASSSDLKGRVRDHRKVSAPSLSNSGIPGEEKRRRGRHERWVGVGGYGCVGVWVWGVGCGCGCGCVGGGKGGLKYVWVGVCGWVGGCGVCVCGWVGVCTYVCMCVMMRWGSGRGV